EVRLVALGNGIQPETMELRIGGNGIRFHIFGHGFIHIALTELRVTPAGPVANELMRERAAHSGKDEIPNRVLQYRAMAHLQAMVQVSLTPTGPRTGKAHVADSTGHFRQLFARYRGIRLPTGAVIFQKAFQLGIRNLLPAHEINGWLTDYTDIHAGIEH